MLSKHTDSLWQMFPLCLHSTEWPCIGRTLGCKLQFKMGLPYFALEIHSVVSKFLKENTHVQLFGAALMASPRL